MKGKMDKKMGKGMGKMPMMSENDMYGMMGMTNSNTKKAVGKKPASKKGNKKK